MTDIKTAMLSGYDHKYMVTSDGKVIKPACVDSMGKNRDPIEMSVSLATGSATVTLVSGGKKTRVCLPNIVVRCFGNAPVGMFYTTPKDGNKRNCSISNLQVHPFGELAGKAIEKLSIRVAVYHESQPDIITEYPSVSSAARAIGISDTVIHRVLKSEGKRRLGIGQGKSNGQCYQIRYIKSEEQIK